MTDLSSIIARDFTLYYQQAAKKIHELIEPLSDQQIWARPYPYGNSVGHLLLHLTGNLNYYIGAEIGGTGYVRNRPLEFSDMSRHPKEFLLQNFDAAIAMVAAALQKQSEQDWPAPYTARGMEDSGDRFTAFLRCAAHISHHTGQIIYLCKELQVKGAA
ncbi:MAG: DinB family protein [Candidatus Angelobacter sp.]